MNSRQATIAKYLDMYENDSRFSADGNFYNAFDQQMNFAPDNLATDGANYYGQGRPSQDAQVSKPYVLNITNSSAAAVNAIIFGYNDFSLVANYGNSAAITITSGIPNVTYARMITQSQNKPFDIGLYRFSCTNTAQLDQVMELTWVDANGRSCSDPIPPIYKDPYQFQNGIVDIWYPTKVDGNTYLTYPILATTQVTLILFPRQIADAARMMVGGQANKPFLTPKISGNNLNVTVSQASPAGIAQTASK